MSFHAAITWLPDAAMAVSLCPEPKSLLGSLASTLVPKVMAARPALGRGGRGPPGAGAGRQRVEFDLAHGGSLRSSRCR